MNKPRTKKPHAPKRRRRPTHHRNPPKYTGRMKETDLRKQLEEVAEQLAGMTLVGMLRNMSIRPSSVLAALNRLAGMEGTERLDAFKNCACRGECLCHSGVQIAAVPCPSDCPNAGTRFDGCHRCDCGKGKR